MEEMMKYHPSVGGNKSVSVLKNVTQPSSDCVNITYRVETNQTSSTKLSCQFCSQTFSDHKSLVKHSKIHYDCSCKACRKDRKKRKVLIFPRKKIVYPLSNYVCVLCNKHFKSEPALEYHLTTHSIIKPHFCVACDKNFATDQQLKVHCITHSNLICNSCVFCGKTFCKVYDLKQHCLTHSEIEFYKCVFCNGCFSNIYELDDHLLMHDEWKFATYVERKRKVPKDKLKERTVKTGTIREMLKV